MELLLIELINLYPVPDSASNVSTFAEQLPVLNMEVLLATALFHARSYNGQKILWKPLGGKI